MVRFLHTADWQLGMTRHYLAGEAEGRFRQGRIDAIAAMGRLAEQRGCAFAVVAGDVFDTNQVDRRTLLRAVEALNDFPVPVWLLPGNHDPLDAASVLASDAFADACADHIGVLTGREPVAADRLAALDRPVRHDDLHVRPDDGDFSDLALAGYAAATRDRLAQLAETGGEQAETAVDALALLLRLSQRSNREATP